MTLSDLWPGFQDLDIFEVEYRKMARRKDEVTIAQEATMPNNSNGVVFCDADWPLNASLGFVSFSWTYCY